MSHTPNARLTHAQQQREYRASYERIQTEQLQRQTASAMHAIMQKYRNKLSNDGHQAPRSTQQAQQQNPVGPRSSVTATARKFISYDASGRVNVTNSPKPNSLPAAFFPAGFASAQAARHSRTSAALIQPPAPAITLQTQKMKLQTAARAIPTLARPNSALFRDASGSSGTTVGAGGGNDASIQAMPPLVLPPPARADGPPDMQRITALQQHVAMLQAEVGQLMQKAAVQTSISSAPADVAASAVAASTDAQHPTAVPATANCTFQREFATAALLDAAKTSTSGVEPAMFVELACSRNCAGAATTAAAAAAAAAAPIQSSAIPSSASGNVAAHDSVGASSAAVNSQAAATIAALVSAPPEASASVSNSQSQADVLKRARKRVPQIFTFELPIGTRRNRTL